MAHVVKDRVQETSTTTGTGTFTLLGAVSGFQTFSSAIGNTNTTYYTIQNGAEWEVGIGTVGAGTLSRDTILESSNAGSAVNFSAGTKQVFCTYPAEKSVDLDTAQTLTNKTISGSSNTLSNIGNSSLTNSSITINGTPVSLGGSTSVGTVTSVSGTAPIASSGGNTPSISISQSNTTTDGYLSSTDWNTFNNKQSALVSGTNIKTVNSNSLLGSGNVSVGTVTSVGVTAGTGISVSGSPITGSGSITVTNTAPDQTVALTAGSNVTITGTYPNFTIAASSGGSAATPTTLGTVYGRTDTSSLQNTALGENAGGALTTGTLNCFIGRQAGRLITNASSNTIYGHNALGNTSANTSYNTGVGTNVFSSASMSSLSGYNTAVGALSSSSIVNGNYNTTIGYSSGSSIANGVNNVVIGANAGGANLTNGEYNIVIGAEAVPSSTSASYEITLGSSSITTFRIPGLSVNWTSSTVPNVNTTATQTLTNKTINGAILNDGYTEEVFAVTDAAGVALSPTNGSIQTWTLGASRTPTAGTWNSGQSMTLMINDGSAFTVTWTTIGVTWVGGSAPTLATTGFTVIELWKVSTTIYGALVGNVA